MVFLLNTFKFGWLFNLFENTEQQPETIYVHFFSFAFHFHSKSTFLGTFALLCDLYFRAREALKSVEAALIACFDALIRDLRSKEARRRMYSLWTTSSRSSEHHGNIRSFLNIEERLSLP